MNHFLEFLRVPLCSSDKLTNFFFSPSLLFPLIELSREWDLDLKKLPNIKMRKFSVSDSLPKREKDLSAKDDKEEENLENEEKSSLESDSGSE